MSQHLAATLARAASYADAQSHPEVTLEHLLLALAEDSDAAGVLRSSNVDLALLAGEVSAHIGRIEDRRPPDGPGQVLISKDLRRILEAAAAAARQGRRGEINGAIVLAAIVGDGKSTAAHLLRAQGLTFEQAIRALQKASTPPAEEQAPRPAPVTETTAPPRGTTGEILANARERVQSRAAPSATASTPMPAPMPAPEPPLTQQAPAPVAAPTPMAREERTEPVFAPPPASYAEPPRPRPDYSAPPPVETAPQPSRPLPREELPNDPMRSPSSPLSPQWQPAGAPPPRSPMAPPANPMPDMARPAPPPSQAPQAPVTAPPQWGPQTGAPSPMQRTGPPPGYAAPPAARPPASAHQPPAGGPPPPQSMQRAPAPAYGGPAPNDPRIPPQVRQRQQAPAGNVRVAAGQLVENIPRRMRVGLPMVVEARVARAEVKAIAEGLQGGGAVYRHEVTVTKAMSVRLRAPDGGFWIETSSPETQWIENVLGLMADDFASWRWTVTPRERGKKRLQLLISARTVGADGLAAETALPDQVIEVKVGINYAQTAVRWAGWIAAAVAGGILARFGEGLFDPILSMVRTVGGA